METNRYILRPQSANGTWSVVDSATGEIAEVRGFVLQQLSKEVAVRMAAALNNDRRYPPPPLEE
jgi:hypothetical protein